MPVSGWTLKKIGVSHKKIKNKIKRWMEKPESALNSKKKKKKGGFYIKKIQMKTPRSA